MTSVQNERLLASLETSFFDARIPSAMNLRPHLVLNDPPRTKVMETLERELASCTSFSFSVAFITKGGLAMLLQPLYEAQRRGVKGKILTSDYLTFTDPDALAFLLEHFPSIELRVYTEKAFHTKGYLFTREEDYATLVVGSSNLTHEALATNQEWNLFLVSSCSGSLVQETQETFQEAWDKAVEVSPAWIAHYREVYAALHTHKRFEPLPLPSLPIAQRQEKREQLVLNAMQVQALEGLERLREQGKDKALLISATGTGKTILLIKDVERQRPRRFLFVVHRQQIAEEALARFKEHLGDDLECGLLCGDNKESDAAYLFATVQTLSKDEVLHTFPKTWFDYLVIDEVHHAGAESYQKILNHFQPAFLLGMTATPYRNDDKDIFQRFDYAVACEIQLNQALDAGMLCPFHYYGVTEFSIQGHEQVQYKDFARLEKVEQVRHINQMLNRYSIGNRRVRGLIFCSRNKDAVFLAQALSELGRKALALSGADSQEAREEAFLRLEMEGGKDALEYLVTVDIFNEGVDIPSLNQVVMLRPTESAIIFVQQLGRGLRKYPGKEFLTVIDFIGNHVNNYMIPMALFGDRTYRKDTLRRLLSEGSTALSGPSTIQFDAVARGKIFEAINRVSFKNKTLLGQEYASLKQRLGRTPKLIDFITMGSLSPVVILEYARTYIQFKERVEKHFVHTLTDLHLKSLYYLGKILARGVRIHETCMIISLLENEGEIAYPSIPNLIQESYGFVPTDQSIDSALRILSNQFFQEKHKDSFGSLSYVTLTKTGIRKSPSFSALLENEEYKNELFDLLEVSKYSYLNDFSERRGSHDLVLYQKYTRQEVCRLLGWERDEANTIYGYKVDYEHHQCPIFVTYHKDSQTIDPGIDYRDRFLSREQFVWETRNNVHLGSKEARAIRGEMGPMEVLLFVQKSNDEGRSFYYLGPLAFLSNAPSSKINGKGDHLPVVMMRFALTHPVPQSLYNYILELVDSSSQTTA